MLMAKKSKIISADETYIVLAGGAAPEGAVPPPAEAGGPGQRAAGAVGGAGVTGAESAGALTPARPLTATAC